MSRVAITVFSSSDSMENLRTSANPSMQKEFTGMLSMLACKDYSTLNTVDILLELRSNLARLDSFEVLEELLFGFPVVHALIVYYQIIRLAK